jgi:glycosyltransferase involved in cell wall biosynthesis
MTGKKKTIIILSGVSSSETGGAVNIISHINLTCHLYKYKVYLMQRGTFKDKLDSIGIDNIVFNFGSKYNVGSYLRVLLSLWGEDGIHCYHTHTERVCFLFNPVLRLMGKRVVTTVHRNISISSIWKSPFMNFIFVKLEDFALRHFTDGVIYVSNTLRDQFVKIRNVRTISSVYKYFPADPRNDVTVFDGSAVFHEIAKLKQRGFLIVGTIARATLEKGLDVLVEQFFEFVKTAGKDYPIALVVLGESFENYLSYFGENLDLEHEKIMRENIIFTGLQKNVDIFYRLIDFYFQPSRSESYGLAVLEASYYGLSIVTSDIEVFGETLREYSSHHTVKLSESRAVVDILLKNQKTNFLLNKTCYWNEKQIPYIERDIYTLV